MFGKSYNYVIYFVSLLCCNAGIPRIAFILTDGRATVDSEQDAKKLKGLDVNVYAIGIGNVINVGALERIASSPADQYVSRIKNYHSIPTLVSESLTKICKSKCIVRILERARGKVLEIANKSFVFKIFC